MNRAAIYARLSLADEKSTSTKRQEKDCRDHAKSLGLEDRLGLNPEARIRLGIATVEQKSRLQEFLDRQS